LVRSGDPAAAPGERRRREAPQIGPHAGETRVQRNEGGFRFRDTGRARCSDGSSHARRTARPAFPQGQRAYRQGPAGRAYETWVTAQPC
jgi:hypothetical protein